MPELTDGPESSACLVHDDDAWDADDDETAALRPLFPDGKPHDKWHELWKSPS